MSAADLGTVAVLVLSPHSRCNCRCVMCDIWQRSGRDELTAEEVTAWVLGLAGTGLREVVLSGGEALLHHDLPGLARSIRCTGIKVTLLSTGLLLGKASGTIGDWCDEVIVSLDGPPPVHDRIRNVPGAFTRLRDGVRAVRAAAPRVTVGARCTLQRANIDWFEATIDAAHALGADWFSVLAVDTSSEAFNRPGGWSDARVEAVLPDADQLAAFDAALGDLDRRRPDLWTRGYVRERPGKIRARVFAPLRAAAGLEPAASPLCNAPWVSAVVDADGTVRPCFFHPPIGNAREAGGLLPVLDGVAARHFRQELDVASNPVCRRCVCSLHLTDVEVPA